ncbi:MAG: hypothetical protein QM270_04465 [Bacillota bacterium]|nr:hypothetical protein [Bacillota bacterium]
MANRQFVGATATQYYSWGYTCELCGRPVEKRSSLRARNGSMLKSTTWAYTSSAGAEVMKDQARMQLAANVAQMDEKIRSGGFEIPQDEEGKCPHCRQYQHWAPAIRSQIAARNNQQSGKVGKLSVGSLTFFVGMWVGIVLMVLVDKLLVPAEEIRLFVLLGVLALGFLLTWIVVRRINKGIDTDLDAQIKALENVEKNEPHFISWGEQTCDTSGLSIR